MLCKCLWHLQHKLRQEAPEVSQERCSQEFPTQFGTVKKLDRLLTSLWFPLFFFVRSTVQETKPLYLLRFAHDYILQIMNPIFQCNWIFCVRKTPDWKEHWLSISFNFHLTAQIQLPSNQFGAGVSFREQGDSSANSGKQISPHTQTSFIRLLYYLRFLNAFIKNEKWARRNQWI